MFSPKNLLCGAPCISALSALKGYLNAEGAEIRRGPQRQFPIKTAPKKIHSFVRVNVFVFTLIIDSLAVSLAKKFSDS
jgi:hypothetical protein